MFVCEVISGYVLIYQVQQAAPHQLTIYLATRRVAMRDRSRHKRSKVSSNASHNTHIHKYSIQTDYVNVHAHLPSMKTWPVNKSYEGESSSFPYELRFGTENICLTDLLRDRMHSAQLPDGEYKNVNYTSLQFYFGWFSSHIIPMFHNGWYVILDKKIVLLLFYDGQYTNINHETLTICSHGETASFYRR